MPLTSPLGYSVTDPTNAWTAIGAVLESAVDTVARTEAEQKDYPAQLKINTMAYAIEEMRQILNGALDIPGPIIVNGNITQDAANAAHTLGDGTGSPITVGKVSATGTYIVGVDDGVNAQDGGWSYNANTDQFFIRAANARRIVVNATQMKRADSNPMSSGTDADRWSVGFFDAVTVTNGITQDADATTINTTQVGASGYFEHQIDDGTNAYDGGWGYSATSHLLTLRAGNTSSMYVGAALMRPVVDSNVQFGLTTHRLLSGWFDAVTVTNDITQDAGASITNARQVGASGVYSSEVDDGTNAFDGGWRYSTASNSMEFRAGNADRLYLTVSQMYPSSDGGLTSGLTNRRWSDSFSHALTVTNGITQDAGASITNVRQVGATGKYYSDVDNGTNARQGGWFYDAQFDTFVLRAANDDQIFIQDGSIYPVLDNDVTSGFTGKRWSGGFFNTLTAGGNFTQDGASPTQIFSKDETGNTHIYFYNVDTSASDKDFRIRHDSNEDFFIQRHDGAAWRSVLGIGDDIAMTLLGDAQGPALVTFGNASHGADDETNLRLSGGPTSDPTVQFIDGTNGIRYDAAGQRFFHSVASTTRFTVDGSGIKIPLASGRIELGDGTGGPDFNLVADATSDSRIHFHKTSASASTGDWRILHANDESFNIAHYDGADYRNVLRSTSATNMRLLGGAQTSPVLTVGNSGFPTGSAAHMQLESGATGTPSYRFDVTNTNRIEYSSEFNIFQFWTESALALSLNATTLAVKDANANLNMGDATGDPTLTFRSDPTGTGRIRFNKTTGAIGAGDYEIRQDSNEYFLISRYDGSAYRDVFAAFGDANVQVMTGAQSAPQFTVGHSSLATGLTGSVLLHSGATSLASYFFRDTGNAVQFDEVGQQLKHLVGGASVLDIGATAITTPNELRLGTFGSGSQTAYFWVGASDVATFAVNDGTDAYNGGWQYNTGSDTLSLRAGGTDRLDLTGSKATFHVNMDLDNASPLLTLGSGSGSPQFRSQKTETGTTVHDWFSDGFIRWRNEFSAVEDLAWHRYNAAGAYQDTPLTLAADGVSYFTNNVVQGSTSAIHRLGDGVTAGSPQINMLKGPTGQSALYFFDTDQTASTGDFAITHGSDEVWRLLHHDGTAFRTALQVNAAHDVIVSGDAQQSSVTYFGNSGFATGSNASLMLQSGDTGAPGVFFDSFSNGILFVVASGTFSHYVAGVDEMQLTAANLVLPSNNFIMSGPSAIQRIGDGTGSPQHRMVKGAASDSQFLFHDTDETSSAADYRWRHNTGEGFDGDRHDGTAWQQWLRVSDDTAMTLLGAAQGTSNLIVGSSAANIVNFDVGQSGLDSVLTIYKAPASSGMFRFRTVVDANTDGDWQLRHESDESFKVRRYDGVTHQDVLKVTDDTDMTLLGGAQGSATVIAGTSSNSTSLLVGLSGGNSVIQMRKAAASAGSIQFLDTDGAASAGDFRLNHSSAENFYTDRFDGAVWQSVISITDDADMALLGSAKAAATLTIGPANEGFEYGITVMVGQSEGNSTVQLRKAASATGALQFLSDDGTPSAGDFQMKQNSVEALIFERHDGTAWRDILACTDDTVMDLLGDAQNVGTLGVGNPSYSTGQYSSVNIRAGATGNPRLYFNVTNNRITYDMTNDIMAFYCNGTSNMSLSSSNWGIFGSSSAQTAAFTRNATLVEDRTLLASASATTTNNNNVIAAIIGTLQAHGIAA